MGAAVTGTAAAPQSAPAAQPRVGLRCRITFRDGRRFSGEIAAERHRLIQLGMLHRHTEGLVELTPGTRDEAGRLHVDRRSQPVHYLPGAARHEARGSKHAVSETRSLCVDIDQPDKLDVLWEFLSERPCHLLVESAGSGGCHAYWRRSAAPGWLRRPRADRAGQPADHPRPRRRHRRPAMLVGDLPDPPAAALRAVRREGKPSEDPYKRIPATAYFPLLAGITVRPRGGLVRCPAHDDERPSCSVSATEPVWACHACGASGTVYDLASAVLGGRPDRSCAAKHSNAPAPTWSTCSAGRSSLDARSRLGGRRRAGRSRGSALLRDRHRTRPARAQGRADRPAGHLPPGQGARSSRDLAQAPATQRKPRR